MSQLRIELTGNTKMDSVKRAGRNFLAPAPKSPFVDLPKELILKIFFHLRDKKDFARATSVCKSWKYQIINNEALSPYIFDGKVHDSVRCIFDKKILRIDFEYSGEPLEVPRGYEKFLRGKCPFWPEKNKIDTHSLYYFSQHLNMNLVLSQYPTMPKMNCGWFLLTNMNIPNNLVGTSYEKQKAVLIKKGYSPPPCAAVVLAMSMFYARFKRPLNEGNFTMCEEVLQAQEEPISDTSRTFQFPFCVSTHCSDGVGIAFKHGSIAGLSSEQGIGMMGFKKLCW